MDPRGFPTSLPEFQKVFPNDDACAKYLEVLRWPNGFVCSDCRWSGEPYRFATRSSVVLRCRQCKVNTSLTAGTVMQSTHMPLSTWFWAAYLVTTQTPGQSALQFQRQLGLSRYETAFQILHKLRAGMVRPDRDPIGAEHSVEVDECEIGGPTRSGQQGVSDKATVIGAVEVRIRQDSSERVARYHRRHKGATPMKNLVYAGRVRLRVVGGDFPSLISFVTENVVKGAKVLTDGKRAYEALPELGYKHHPLILAGDPNLAQGHLPMIHLVFSNLKTWILGTHHGAIAQRHLQAYLNEYVFRFNRRFYPMTAFNSVLGLSAHSVPPTYEALYSGRWIHPVS